MTPATSARHTAHRELRIRGLRIHAQICGEGEPLLLCSPIWSQAGVWEPLLPYLTGFRTIAFDRRGQRLRAASPAERGGRDGAGEDYGHYLAQRGLR